jgi:hypothetical protein
MIQTIYKSTTRRTYFSFSNLEQQFKEVMEMKVKPTLLAEERVSGSRLAALSPPFPNVSFFSLNRRNSPCASIALLLNTFVAPA